MAVRPTPLPFTRNSVQRPPGHFKLVPDPPKLDALREDSPAPQSSFMSPRDLRMPFLLPQPSGKSEILSEEPAAQPLRGSGREESRVLSRSRRAFLRGGRGLVRWVPRPQCPRSRVFDDLDVRDRSHGVPRRPRRGPEAMSPVEESLSNPYPQVSYRRTPLRHGRGGVVRLTSKERILLHLLEHARHAEAPEVPPAMTQEGVTNAAGIDLRHLSQYMRPLVRDGNVRERMAHVTGIRQRRKVYDHTDSGRLIAMRLRDSVKAEVVRVREAGELREATVAQVLDRAAGNASLSDILRAAIDVGTVDLEALTAPPRRAFVEMVSEAPRLRRFVGRSVELGEVTRASGGPRLFVVRGVAGIGKSSFAARACEMERGRRNLFWHRVRPWDTRQSVLASLGDFLSALGKPGLRSVLSRGEAFRADRVLRDDLPGAPVLIVFDDAHEASPVVVSVLGFLKEAAADAENVRMLVLTRRSLPFYDARDVAVLGLVREIDLGGLRDEDIEDFLAGESTDVRHLARQLGGHPLFLELLRSTEQKDPSSDALRDMQRFMEDQVYADLSEEERTVMKAASLYRVPVPRDALFPDPAVSHETLVSLTNRSLIRGVGETGYGLHDTIRVFFSAVATPAERERLGIFAGGQLQRLAAEAQTAGNPVAAIHYLSNALQITVARDGRSTLAEALGDAHERIGDLPAALAAYEEALGGTDEAESVARIRRKAAAALQVRGETSRATSELDAGSQALGERPSVERGWLDLIRCQLDSKIEEWPEAPDRGEAALATFRGYGDFLGQTQALLALANAEIYSPSGNPAEAERYLTSALEVSKALAAPELRGRVHIVLANLYANRIGDVERATRHLESLEELEDSIKDPHIRRSFLMLHAWFALYQRADFGAAEHLFTQALELGEKIHAPSTIASAKFGLAHVLYFDDSLDDARRAFEECALQLDAQGFHGSGMEARWMVAECCMRLGDLDGFLRIAEEYRDPRLSAGGAAPPPPAELGGGLG